MTLSKVLLQIFEMHRKRLIPRTGYAGAERDTRQILADCARPLLHRMVFPVVDMVPRGHERDLHYQWATATAVGRVFTPYGSVVVKTPGVLKSFSCRPSPSPV